VWAVLDLQLESFIVKGSNDTTSGLAESCCVFIHIIVTCLVVYLSLTWYNFLFNFPLYLQSVPVHSANLVKACRRVLTSALLY
jgi:hypothetical protein